MITDASQLDAVIAVLRSLADEAFRVADRVQAVVADHLGTDARPTREGLAFVEDVAVDALTAPGSNIQGAGFVVAAGLMQDSRWWLEWYVRDAGGRPSRLQVHSDPLGMGFQDYEPLGWYAVPRTTGSRHVTGPYLDSMCTEDYTLTFTQPMTVDGTFVGVAGADIAVRSAEAALLPALRRIESPAAVVNADNRILVSNTGQHVCGELLAAGVGTEVAAVAGSPLYVISLASDDTRAG